MKFNSWFMIRVVLPFHLRNLARVDGEVQLEVAAPVTIGAVLDALEARYPVLRGTIRDHGTLKRRPFVRFFACKEDLSLEPPETIARRGRQRRGTVPDRRRDGGRLNGDRIRNVRPTNRRQFLSKRLQACEEKASDIRLTQEA